ncbi:MAG: HAMP domain-containing histidine kinase [Candidatus Pacebacteria bacterium]|nr:HAMP domain-containing histidine kinase [Candidatus Paceibacterota bacterium]MCF7857691.1 HAMP domain-containing histidine kinase [Candidatus Paceibacterota bacterium]
MISTGITIGDGPLTGVFDEDVRSHEISETLFQALVMVNTGVWFIASLLSYFLARITLQPIKDTYELQEKFVADVAHELRTPLAVMKSASEMALRSERSNIEYKNFISDSLEEVDRLITITSDLLFLLQHKFLNAREKESIDLSDIVHKSVERIRMYAQERKISIVEEIQNKVFIRGVESDLQRLLSNVLKNALDYNIPDGSVQVALKREGTNVLLSISDTGIGMSESVRTRVFDRFYKADIARMQKGSIGSGLGLSIVKEIIDTQGGTVIVASEVGKGSTFTISLPCV